MMSDDKTLMKRQLLFANKSVKSTEVIADFALLTYFQEQEDSLNRSKKLRYRGLIHV